MIVVECKKIRNVVYVLVQALLIYWAFLVVNNDVLNYWIESQGYQQLLSGEILSLWVSGEGYRQLFDMILPYSIFRCVMVWVIIYGVRKCHEFNVELYEHISILIFTFLFTCGYCFTSQGDMGIYFQDIISAILLVAFLAGVYYFFLAVYKILREWCNNYTIKCSFLSQYKCTFKSNVIVLYIAWLPYALIKYPAGFESDAYHQVQQFLGVDKLSNHWPVASSALMGSIVKFGQIVFGSYEAGAFLYVLVQMLMGALVFSYSLQVLQKMNIRRNVVLLILCLYAAVPLFSGYITSIIKDTVYSLMVFMLIILMTEFMFLDQRRYLALLGTCFLMSILRHNGIYIVLFCGILLGIYCIKNRKKEYFKLLSVFVVCIFMYSFYSNVFISDICGIETPDSIKTVKYTIPFQQTARYVSRYPQDVTEEEKEIINSVLDYDKLSELYNPLKADPVNLSYHGTKKDMIKYFGVWMKQFVRHPGVYFAATFNTTYGFVYPDIKYEEHINSGMYIFVGENDEYAKMEYKVPGFLRIFRRLLRAAILFLENFPLLIPFVNVALYNWLLIYVSLREIHLRRIKMIYLLIPLLVTLLVCIVSPTFNTNGVRYALPIMFSMYFVCAVLFEYND